MIICLAGMYFFVSEEVSVKEVKPVIEKSNYQFITIESGDLVPTQAYLDLQDKIEYYNLNNFKKPDPKPIKPGIYTLVVKK